VSGIFKVVAYILITLFLGVILKELGFKGARLVFVLGTISVVGAVAAYVGTLVTVLDGVVDVNGEYTVAILKIVGIGYVFGVCSDICTELGEGVLANSVCLFGRVEIMMVCIPFIKTIIEKGISIIQ
jgi:stage III sporulation protein AD